MSREFTNSQRIETDATTTYVQLDSGQQGTLRALSMYCDDETAVFKVNIYYRDVRLNPSDDDPMLDDSVYRVLPEQTLTGGTPLHLFEKWYSYQTHFEKDNARTGIRGFLYMEIEKESGLNDQVIDLSYTVLRA